MCEFCADHGLNEICGRIVSNYPHITQPFDTYDRNEMKMILSVRITAYPSFGRDIPPGILTFRIRDYLSK
jgi:hypothetical protein